MLREIELKRRHILAKYLHRAHEKLRKKRMLKAAERSSDTTREDMERRDQDARFQLAMQIAIRAGKERAPIGISKHPGTSRPIFFY